MLNVGLFIQGKDEDRWVSVANRAFREFIEFRTFIIDEVLRWEKSPAFDAAGIFIAEYNGAPVGIINAYVDKMRAEKKGFINNFGVVPEFRRRGIGTTLEKKALESLSLRGMEVVEASADMDKVAANEFWKKLGFSKVRVFSLMKSSLENLPTNVGESIEATIRKIQRPSDENIRLINWLGNETFSEHYNFRPASVDETRFFLTKDPVFKEQEWIIASLNDSPVGYVGVGVDERYNEEKNAKAAWILDIGVLKVHRLRGIGTRLMLEAMQLIKTKYMTEAMLGVDDQNPTFAIKLYEKVGFHVARNDVAYQKTL